MKKQIFLILLFLVSGFLANSQITWTPERIKALTPEWEGERSPDGRPLVSNSLLERLKAITIDDAWNYLKDKGYPIPFETFSELNEKGWIILHPDQPMTGRVVTAQFMPSRPDYLNYTLDEYEKEGNTLPLRNSSPLNILTEGDVYVADSYGKMINGTLIGDNLGNQIYQNTKRGFIINGAIRDHEGNSKISGLNGWFRGSNPGPLVQTICVSINSPIRIGNVTVLPGDVVLAKFTGVIFIPAHLVADLVISGEYTLLFDQFTKLCVETKRFEYKNERFVNVTPEEFQKALMDWLDKKTDLPMPRQELYDYIKSLKQ